jgi:hypothetical protein
MTMANKDLLLNVDYLFIDLCDERYDKNNNKFFVQTGFNDDKACGEILAEFDEYEDALLFAKELGNYDIQDWTPDEYKRRF